MKGNTVTYTFTISGKKEQIFLTQYKPQGTNGREQEERVEAIPQHSCNSWGWHNCKAPAPEDQHSGQTTQGCRTSTTEIQEKKNT